MSEMDYSPKVDQLRARYERMTEGSGLATQLGRTGAASALSNRAQSVLARIQRQGGNVEGLDIADYGGEFSPTGSAPAVQALSSYYGRRADARGGNRDRAMNSARTRIGADVTGLLTEREKTRKQGELDTSILPPIDTALSRVNEMAGQAAISAEEEQAIRSQIAGTNRAAAQSNLGRVSGALGLRGMSNSPAAAAIASSMAEDYDTSLSNSLRDLGLEVSQTNRAEGLRNATAVANLATLRANVENAYIQGDTQAVIDLASQSAALADTLYSRNQYLEMMDKAMERQDSGKGGMIGALAGGALGAFGGPAGMMAGAQMGGALGGSYDAYRGKPGYQTPNMMGSMAELQKLYGSNPGAFQWGGA